MLRTRRTPQQLHAVLLPSGYSSPAVSVRLQPAEPGPAVSLGLQRSSGSPLPFISHETGMIASWGVLLQTRTCFKYCIAYSKCAVSGRLEGDEDDEDRAGADLTVFGIL